MLEKRSEKVDHVLNFQVPDDVLVREQPVALSRCYQPLAIEAGHVSCSGDSASACLHSDLCSLPPCAHMQPAVAGVDRFWPIERFILCMQMDRITGRLVHPASGRSYHEKTHPPKTPVRPAPVDA